MKKIRVLIFVFVALFPCLAFAQDNFVRLRNIYDANRHESQQYILFENNSSDLFAIGTKLIVGKDGLFILNPYAYYKLRNNQWGLDDFQIGSRYIHDSFGTDSIGPSLRYIRKLWDKIGFCLELTQYLDINRDKHKIDFSIAVTSLDLGWYWGTEFWYFHIFDEVHSVYPRPARIGYRFSDKLSISAMYECRTEDLKFRGHAIYLDWEFRF